MQFSFLVAAKEFPYSLENERGSYKILTPKGQTDTTTTGTVVQNPLQKNHSLRYRH